MKTQIPAVNKVQVVLSIISGELIMTMPSGKQYQHTTKIISLEDKVTTYVNIVSIVNRSVFKRFIAKMQQVFSQGELKNLTIRDIEIVTSLKKEEVEKFADKISAMFNHLSVKEMTFKNKRYHKEEIDNGHKIWKFMKENFVQDLQLLSN